MCGKFFVDYDDEKAKKLIEEAFKNKRKKEYEQIHFFGGEVFPGMAVPVICKDGATLMKWGFPPLLADKKDHINIRSETAANLKTFSEAMISRRCVIPANAYYEWQRLDNKKIPYEFTLTDRELFYLAGLFSSDEKFAILTKEAIPKFMPIHHRMPVIIPEYLLNDWLSKSYSCMQESLIDLHEKVFK